MDRLIVTLASGLRGWAVAGLLACAAAAAVGLAKLAGAVQLPGGWWTAGAIGAIGLVVGLPLAVNGLRNWGTQVQVFERGFALLYRGETRRFAWTDVRSLAQDKREVLRSTSDPMQTMRTDDCVITFKDGTRIVVGSSSGAVELRSLFRPCPLIADCKRLRKEYLKQLTT